MVTIPNATITLRKRAERAGWQVRITESVGDFLKTPDVEIVCLRGSRGIQRFIAIWHDGKAYARYIWAPTWKTRHGRRILHRGIEKVSDADLKRYLDDETHGGDT